MDGRPAKRKRWILFVLFLLVIVSLITLQKLVRTSSNTVISPIPDGPMVQNTPHPKTFNFFRRQKNPDDLLGKINAVIGNNWSDYSIVVEDYTSDFLLNVSEGEIFVAASVNKVPILAALYYYAGKGEIDLNRDVTIQANDIQDYGTGSIRYDKPGSVYSVKTLAKLMIKQSDNTAAYILANHIIGFPKLKTIVSEWGLTQTDMVKNTTSNQDTAKLFRMIYDGKIANQAYTQEILSFLKDTDFETRLPAKLPERVITYHKIGTEAGIVHDAGIVTDGKVTYYIGVFTNGVSEGEEADTLMADVSKAIYEYMR